MRVPHKSESTKVNLRGGVIRSSDTRSLTAFRAKGSHHSSVAIATTRRRQKQQSKSNLLRIFRKVRYGKLTNQCERVKVRVV